MDDHPAQSRERRPARDCREHDQSDESTGCVPAGAVSTDSICARTAC